MQVKSLTLLRTPKYEGLLDADERGVKASVVTTRRRYKLNVQNVDHEDMKKARGVLEQMNFDQRFVLRIS